MNRFPTDGKSNMLKDPLISIVVPTHNRPVFLKKTLVSIIQQTYKNLEVLVVSNGSNEHNRKVVEDLQDPRVCYFEQENSGGPASPRNNGIKRAKGKYIAFCDDDDLWMPEKLQLQLEALEHNHDHGLCFTKMLRFDEKDQWTLPHEEGQATLHSLLYTNTVPISSVIIRRDLLSKFGGFNESRLVGFSEDYEFLLRFASVTRFYYLDKYLIKYWSGVNRVTATDSNRTMKDCLDQLGNILGCFWLTARSKRVSYLVFIKPLLFHIKNFIKSITYILFQKFSLLKLKTR